jgi:thiol-disulfide isomerase/thioredoxin
MNKGFMIAAVAGCAAAVAIGIAVPRLRLASKADDAPATASETQLAKAPDVAACPADAKPANFNFTLKDVDGRDVALTDYKGKVVLLDFWATWCGPCKIEIPAFIDLYTKYKPQGFEVVSVVLLDRFVNAKPFAQKMKMNYPVLDGDPQQDKIDDAYGPLFGLPMSFLISREGRVCRKHLGLPATKDGKEPDEKTVKAIFEAELKALL